MKSVVCVLALAVLLVGAACTSEEDRQRGWHCLSRWDGQHDGLIERVKHQMHDPGSFEEESTITYRNGEFGGIEGTHLIVMSFRGKNAFGATVLNNADGLIDHETCELIGPVNIWAP